PDISEGFENRLSSAAGQATGVSSLLSLAATRRYPVSRIKRILMQALLCIDSSIVQSLRENGPGYARLLGLRVGAEKLLGELQQRATIPIVSRPAKHKDNDCFAVDIRATDLHALAAGLPAGLDFTRAIVRV
ncbi:MAG: nucleotidyltransferase family protein, partial [Clostridia bacterium]|nr:nucleotidyltransferase family protein [Clostridia bacterium]